MPRGGARLGPWVTLSDRQSSPLDGVDTPPARLRPGTPRHRETGPVSTPAPGAPAGPPRGAPTRVWEGSTCPRGRGEAGHSRPRPARPAALRTGQCPSSHVRSHCPAVPRMPTPSGLRRRGSTPREGAARRGLSSLQPSWDAPHSRTPAAPRSAAGARAERAQSARRATREGRAFGLPLGRHGRARTCVCARAALHGRAPCA